MQHSDMLERDRDFELVHFRGLSRAAGDASREGAVEGASVSSGGDRGQHFAASLGSNSGRQFTNAMLGAKERTVSSALAEDPHTFILVTTDPPLKAAPRDLLPLLPSLLIQFDLPGQKVWHAHLWFIFIYSSSLARFIDT